PGAAQAAQAGRGGRQAARGAARHGARLRPGPADEAAARAGNEEAGAGRPGEEAPGPYRRGGRAQGVAGEDRGPAEGAAGALPGPDQDGAGEAGPGPAGRRRGRRRLQPPQRLQLVVCGSVCGCVTGGCASTGKSGREILNPRRRRRGGTRFATYLLALTPDGG